MSSPFFMFVQFAILSTVSCKAAGEAVLQSPATEGLSSSGGFLSQLFLDEALLESFQEAILVISVFGMVSAVLSAYRKHTGKNAGPRKTKRISFNDPADARAKKTQQNRVNNEEASTRPRSPNSALGRKILSTCERMESNSKPPGLSLSQSANGSDMDALARAVRGGKAAKLPELLDAAWNRSVAAATQEESEGIATQLLISALRACAAARCFNEAVAAYEHMHKRIGEGCPSLWSVLLYSIVETGAFHRSKHVLEKLCKQGSPSEHDFVNIVRCYAGQQDAVGLRAGLEDLRQRGQTIDCYTWNRALAACGTSEYALSLAEELVAAGISDIDAVGYNTLMKYNGRAGRISRCFELRAEMASKGIQPSEVTFGILLDACVAMKELTRARKVFSELCSSGLQLNVVHCTTFIKVLLAARLLDEASAVLKEMLQSPGAKPDLITFSIIVKAHAEEGNVSGALKLLDMMAKEGVKPDEILFNSILSGCFAFPVKSAEVMKTFDVLVGYGLKPSTTTISILLKALAHTSAWQMSLQILEESPERFRLQPEARLYAQLAQACAKAREPKTVLKVFEAMLEDWRRRGQGIDKDGLVRFLRSCLLGSAPEVAAELRETMHRAGIKVDDQLDRMLRTSLARRA